MSISIPCPLLSYTYIAGTNGNLFSVILSYAAAEFCDWPCIDIGFIYVQRRKSPFNVEFMYVYVARQRQRPLLSNGPHTERDDAYRDVTGRNVSSWFPSVPEQMLSWYPILRCNASFPCSPANGMLYCTEMQACGRHRN
jgi:hypothetical protein